MSDPVILERLDTIETMLKAMPVPEYVDTRWFAKKLGCSDTYLRAHWWLLPNFGVYDFPDKRSWHFLTGRPWLDVPMSVHQAEWDALPAHVKKAIALKRAMGIVRSV